MLCASQYKAHSTGVYCGGKYVKIPVISQYVMTFTYVLHYVPQTVSSEWYEGWSKIFQTDAVKIIKLTIRPIGRRHPWNSSLPHVDTGPTVSSIFGTLPGSPFLSECQALSAIRPVSPQWYQTGVLSASISFLEIGRSHRVPNVGSTVGGDSHFAFRQKLLSEDGNVSRGVVMGKQPAPSTHFGSWRSTGGVI